MTYVRLLAAVLAVGLLVLVPVRNPAPAAAQSGCFLSPPASDANPAALVAADNTFGFRLLAATGGEKNTFLSPVSAALALHMALGGAGGATAASMQRALSLPRITRTTLAAEDEALLDRLDVAGGLTLGDSVWVRAHVPIQPSFRSWVQALGTVRSFRGTSPAALNNWIDCATRGTIPGFIRSIPRSTLVYLLNAVYFHGIWARVFDPKVTRLHRFTTAAGTAIQVPMMAQLSLFPYTQGPGYQAVRLPYTGGRLSMVVILPRSPEFVRSLTAARFNRIVGAMRMRAGSLLLPRFSVRIDRDLKGPLTALGMGNAFTDRADFSRLCLQRCDLSDVRQGTYLSINEHGTVASAITSAGVSAVAIPAATFRMTVDRPFLLAIQDSGTGSILFVGSIGNP
ncbi:MAG TPA: serpin family protein [Chloroflexota bacterium]|nr:serpin family protein [Chloroflexota bacterium]